MAGVTLDLAGLIAAMGALAVLCLPEVVELRDKPGPPLVQQANKSGSGS